MSVENIGIALKLCILSYHVLAIICTNICEVPFGRSCVIFMFTVIYRRHLPVTSLTSPHSVLQTTWCQKFVSTERTLGGARYGGIRYFPICWTVFP